MALVVGARDFELDPTTNDLVIESGDFVLVKEGDAISQDLRLRLGFFKGEWFLNEETGIPYFQNILVKNPNLGLIRELYRKEIDATQGVNEIKSLDLGYDAAERELEVTWRVDTDFGELISEQ